MTHLVTSTVTVNNETELDRERKITAGSGIVVTDGGAGSTITIAAESGEDIGGNTNDIVSVNVAEQGSAPATPAANRRKIYPKTDGWYDLDDAGLETRLGVGALNDLTDVDTSGTATGDVIYNSGSGWVDYPLGLGTKVTVDGNKIKFGNVGGGNYLEIDTSTGNLRLVGSAAAWDDLRISGAMTRVGSTAPALGAFGPSGSLKTLRFENGHHDEVHFEIQMPHNWKEGSNIYPHVHWSPISATAGNVVWELEYAWADIGGTFDAPGNMASAATAAGGTAWVHKMSDLLEGGNEYIVGTGKTMSSMLVCRLHRNAGAGSDTLAADVALLEFDLHYEVDGFGSDEELVKDSTASMLLETGDYLLLESGDNLLLN